MKLNPLCVLAASFAMSALLSPTRADAADSSSLKMKDGDGWKVEAEAKLNKGGNSGMCFRAGSIYNIVKVFDKLVDGDTRWTQNLRTDPDSVVHYRNLLIVHGC